MLKAFSLSRYTFLLEADAPIQLHPDNPGNTLRGAFGLTFKRLVCPSPRECQLSCIRKHICPYGQVFEPSPPPNAERLRLNADIPRPFVYRPVTSRADPRWHEPFLFELILIGTVQAMFPYFLVTFRELGTVGLGRTRGTFRIHEVRHHHEVENTTCLVYSGRTHCVRPDQTALTVADCMQLAKRYRMNPPSQLTIQFLTPTHLKANGQLVTKPEFHHLIKRLRDRINALAYFYSGETLAIDHHAFGTRAEAIRTVRSTLHWVSQSRRSWKTQRHHDMGGFVGEVTYEGDFTEFLPLLILGQYTHVGKYAVWGNGWYTL
ncbi:MAG: CRISPR system precrRNA processing endoribonuclease RAMP protein Cas6, partial [Nitrospirae bacterium]